MSKFYFGLVSVLFLASCKTANITASTGNQTWYQIATSVAPGKTLAETMRSQLGAPTQIIFKEKDSEWWAYCSAERPREKCGTGELGLLVDKTSGKIDSVQWTAGSNNEAKSKDEIQATFKELHLVVQEYRVEYPDFINTEKVLIDPEKGFVAEFRSNNPTKIETFHIGTPFKSYSDRWKGEHAPVSVVRLDPERSTAGK